MKQRFYLFRRRKTFYLQDSETGKQESLKTRDRSEAERLWRIKNDELRHPLLNLTLGKAYLAAYDPKLIERTWTMVMEEFCKAGGSSTQLRRNRAIRSAPFDLIRGKKLVETTGDDLRLVIRAGGVFTNHFLRCLHNLALGLGWLPWPIIPPKMWPTAKSKPKRGVTAEEHQKILSTENNSERRAFYELLWETGAAQSDAANLVAENIDWTSRTLAYQRQKTGEWANLRIGLRLEGLLKQLPNYGFLFPKISQSSASARSAEFCRRCRLLGIEGVSLHSYRYAWAERAKSVGYPERWAQNALGHSSKAVHQAYAKGAKVICPSLEDYERKVIPMVEGVAMG